jgi:hypothetical protein
VLTGSLAEKNGLLVGDIILTINGRPAYNKTQISEIIAQTEGKLELTVLRQGQSQNIALSKKLGEPVGLVFKADIISNPQLPSQAPTAEPNRDRILKK